MQKELGFAILSAAALGIGACSQTLSVGQSSSFATQTTAAPTSSNVDAEVARRLAAERTLATDVLAAIAYQRVTGRPLNNVASQSAADRVSLLN